VLRPYIVSGKEVTIMEFTVALFGLLTLFVVTVGTLLLAYIGDEEVTGRRHEAWYEWGVAEAAMPAPA
jgi:hypothetical protein